MKFVTSELGDDPIVVEGYFAAAPDRIFRAWTDPEIVKKWFGPRPGSAVSARIDLRTGGTWCVVLRIDGDARVGFTGEYLVIEPDRRLVFSWAKFSGSDVAPDADLCFSRVEILLSPNGGGTEIRIVHSSITDEETRVGFTGGWEHGIQNLERFLTG